MDWCTGEGWRCDEWTSIVSLGVLTSRSLVKADWARLDWSSDSFAQLGCSVWRSPSGALNDWTKHVMGLAGFQWPSAPPLPLSAGATGDPPPIQPCDAASSCPPEALQSGS